LFSATADHLARTTFYDWPAMVTVARFVIPAVIIEVEVMISLYMYLARDEESRDLDPSVPSWAWEVIGFLLALAMPAAVVATYLAAHQGVTDPGQGIIFQSQLAGLVILSLVAHIAVLFGGGPACEAKAFFVDRATHAWLRHKCHQEEVRDAQSTRAAVGAFEEYLRLLNQCTQWYPDTPLIAGPFSEEERKFFKAYYGYEIIPHPNDGNSKGPDQGPEPNAPQNPPPPPPVDPLHSAGPENGRNEEANGETDYLRTILNRQIRDNESEVRP
jgi:hypothetical protein